MEEFLVTSDQPELFSVEGQIPEEQALALEEATHTRSTAEITSLFRAKNYVSIGKPLVFSLGPLLTGLGSAVSTDIQLAMADYEFYVVQLACSFQPAPSCRFSDARFALTLETVPLPANTGIQTLPDSAIAYDLFPQRVEDEYKVSTKYSFSPELKFEFVGLPASPSLALPFYEHTKEHLTYKGRIFAFGLQDTQPAWSFTRTGSHEISGPQKLFMVVRKPKGTHVMATFSLTAGVQFLIGGKMPLDPLSLVTLFRRSAPQPTIIDTPAVPLC